MSLPRALLILMMAASVAAVYGSPAVFAEELVESRPIDSAASNMPYLRLIEGIDCGSASVAVVSRFFGKNLSSEEAIAMVDPDSEGVSSLAAISRSLENQGLETIGVAADVEDLVAIIPEGAVSISQTTASSSLNHFVVVVHVAGGRFYVIDFPTSGWLDSTRLENSWLGKSLIVSPKEGLGDRVRSSLSRLTEKKLARADAQPAILFEEAVDVSSRVVTFSEDRLSAIVAVTISNRSIYEIGISDVKACCGSTVEQTTYSVSAGEEIQVDIRVKDANLKRERTVALLLNGENIKRGWLAVQLVSLP